MEHDVHGLRSWHVLQAGLATCKDCPQGKFEELGGKSLRGTQAVEPFDIGSIWR